jgi:ADA HAT complex component 1
MFRLPSWISESRGCDKVVNGEAAHKMANATRPVVEIFPGGVSKRKRGSSADATELMSEGTHDAKRKKMDALADTGQDTESRVERLKEEKEGAVDPERVRETIESQFSLEILLKHNELRLINQELAKCQIALEQLRRCHLIPYPTSQGTVESMLSVSNGNGPAIRQRDNVPQWAAPYGVTDGPYTRHYAKWLIPDPSFDGVQIDWYRGTEGSRAGKTVPEGRSTRHNFADGNTPGGKSRSQRGSAGQKLQALSSGYPQAKEKAGPCVLKRGDGQMVKLVCIDCHRENFSSTQGFINHCRIAHRRDFKSHEEAAVASGQPIEVDETGGIVGDEKNATAANGLVHPLIRSAPTDKAAYAALLSRIHDSLALYEQGKLPGVTSIPSSANSTPLKISKATPAPNRTFVPSIDTPHLSDLMRRRGFAGNLTDIVGEAKKRVDLEELSSHDEESEDGEGIFPQRRPGGLDGTDFPLPAMRVPARAAMSPALLGRPGSSKGIDGKNGRKPGLSGISPRLSHATPVINTLAAANHNRSSTRLVNGHGDFEAQHEPDLDEMTDGPSIIDLSPNTVASNNAPSLVSDDGEYDEGDDDAESASSEDEEEGSDVAEIDIEDDTVEKVVPRTVLRNRSGSGGDGMRLRKEGKDKHVTFVSPVKEAKERPRRK